MNFLSLVLDWHTYGPSSLHNPRSSIQIYKALYLLFTIINQAFSNLLAYGGASLSAITIPFTLHFCTAYNGPIPERLLALFGFLVCGGYAHFVLQKNAIFYLHSRGLISCWRDVYVPHLKIQQQQEQGKQQISDKERSQRYQTERRSVATLRPMQIHAGCYVLNELTVLHFWDLVANNTILFACTFPFE